MVQIALIGCGAVVHGLYIQPLRKLEAQGMARVVALVDRDQARILHIQKAFPKAKGHHNPVEAFTSHQIDLAIVTSPPGFHAEHALLAFSHGSHVLCEKPLATLVEDGRKMVAACQAAKRVLAVGMTRRFYGSFALAKMLIDSGGLGSDLEFTYLEGSVFDWPITSDAAFRRKTAGGGVIMDKGSHAIDFLLGLFGDLKVKRFQDDAIDEGTDSNCHAELQGARAHGTMRLSWDQALVSGLHIKGTKGELKVLLDKQNQVLHRQANQSWQVIKCTETWPMEVSSPSNKRGLPKSYYDCIFFQLVQILRSIQLGEPVPVGGEEGVRSIQIIEDSLAMSTPLVLPWLSEAEQAVLAQRHWNKKN